MTSNRQLVLYPCRGDVPQYIFDEYKRSGWELVAIKPKNINSDHSFIRETSTLYIHEDNRSCQNILKILSKYISYSEVILRQYIEYGSFLLNDIPKEVFHLVVLGDTHHLKGLIKRSVEFLSSNIPTILTSYANPADALIVGMILGLSKNQICLYPPSLVVRNTFQGLELNKKELTAAKNLYGLFLL